MQTEPELFLDVGMAEGKAEHLFHVPKCDFPPVWDGDTSFSTVLGAVLCDEPGPSQNATHFVDLEQLRFKWKNEIGLIITDPTTHQY